MSDQIVTREGQRKRGERAYASGVPRTGHGMRWDAAALPDWHQGWDDAAALARAERVREAEEV